AGLSRVGGNTKLYRNLLNKFAQNQGSALKEIKAALQNNDIELAERLAHTIKGVAGNIGAMGLHSAARDLESEIREKQARVSASTLALIQSNLDIVLDSIRETANKLQRKKSAKSAPGQGESIDRAAVERLLRELTELLEDDDTDAVNTIEKLKEHLQEGSDGWTALSGVEKAVGQYDFEKALELLERVTI
ncbi:MAG: Hpt domain-containing protein, partial [SAR324 cluster bacterium]|nr:Hpt domain-containing protein [SAR324 cluster bacterium]